MSWVDDLAELYSDFDEDFLMHFGVGHDENPPGRGSGRYEFGSGERIAQHKNDLYARYRKLKKAGLSDKEIAKSLGLYLKDSKGNPKLDENGDPIGSVPLLRAKVQIERNRLYSDLANKAKELENTVDPETGKRMYSRREIAEMLGLPNESSVRSLLNNEEAAINRDKTNQAVSKLKELVNGENYIDVGRGAELYLGISKDRLNVALEMLKEEGYDVQAIYVNQVGMSNGTKTTVLTLCPPGSEPGDAFRNRFQIKSVDPDGSDALTQLGMQVPEAVDVSRVQVKFAEEGGSEKDGVIEIRAYRDEEGYLRPACEDLSLGEAKYAQVRIAVDATGAVSEHPERYIKGMAVYSTDLPDGVDILVNSNYSSLDKALKEQKRIKDKEGNDAGVDQDNPFGATVYQTNYISKDGTEKLSAINIVGDVYGVDKHEEGAWDDWSRNLASQFLGKQSENLIKQQLKLKVTEKQEEYEEILRLNNPVVKKQMLMDFADSCDAAAVDLKAAPLPGQRVQVLLPLTTAKANEVYAPNYPDGTTLALVRFPHTGPFEIPIVKVNNKIAEARDFLEDSRGQAKDAIGISKTTAQILSGADFDGDTAVCIPLTRVNSRGEFEKVVNIKGIGNGQPVLHGLTGFDPSEAYPEKEGMHYMSKREKGIEMGRISNLITDMSVKGCEDTEELERAVKYSMVVIDAEKHKLNYKQAEKDYRIDELREKYQSNKDGTHGPSTILSRAAAEKDVDQRSLRYTIDPETGKKVYQTAKNAEYEVERKVKAPAPEGYTYTDKEGKSHKSKYLRDEDGKILYLTDDETGKVVYEKTGKMTTRQQKSTRMAEADDAYELLSDNPSNKEIIYADYANKMKAMANTARKEYLATPRMRMNSEAKKEYATEVASLNRKLNDAKKNAPKERQAQLLATQIINQKKQDNPDMSAEELKRLEGQALNGARSRTGAKKQRVKFTEKEWEAVNAGAISENVLVQLLKNGDADNYKSLATPRQSRISESTANRIQALLNAGWTKRDIVDAGYASETTVEKVQKGQF